jgi:hypothetical protein
MDKKNIQSVGIEFTPADIYLKQIANCLAYLIINSDKLKGKANRDLIPILASLGFDRINISSILQTTPETVSVRLSQLKAGAKGNKENIAESENGKSSDAS